MRLLAILLFLFPSLTFAQSSVIDTILHDELERIFLVSTPSYYDGSESMPVVFNFHGFGSNYFEQSLYGEFRPLAESEGFIVVHPNGTEIQGQGHWNVGGFTLGSSIDDVGFTSTLIDHLIDNYNIDEERIYATGMSNGGFMSYLLACELGDRFAAIASVTGSMTPELFDNCTPAHPTPVMQIHGTNDEVVPYDGAFFSASIPDVVDFWVEYNNCNLVPTETDIQDTNLDDASTAEHFVYADCDNNITTELFKITGGDHSWPDAIIGGQGTNRDINASNEIWNFFKRFTLSSGAVSNTELIINEKSVNIFPNPSNGNLQIESQSRHAYQLLSSLGEVLHTGILSQGSQELSFNLSPGTYFFRTNSQSQKLFIVK